MVTQTYGDGGPCGSNPEHGRMYRLSDGREWCPHSDHTSHAGKEHKMAFTPKKGASSLDKPEKKPTPIRAARSAKPKDEAPKPARAGREPKACKCGCGGMTKGGTFLPGHDAKYHSAQKAKGH